MENHKKWFATIQALVDILGEMLPIMVVFTMQVVFQICKPRRNKKSQDPNDTMNSHKEDGGSHDMGL